MPRKATDRLTAKVDGRRFVMTRSMAQAAHYVAVNDSATHKQFDDFAELPDSATLRRLSLKYIEAEDADGVVHSMPIVVTRGTDGVCTYLSYEVTERAVDALLAREDFDGYDEEIDA